MFIFKDHIEILRNVLLALALVTGIRAAAQPPIISGLSKSSGALNDSITIVGSNFSSNPADMILYFGGVQGTIMNSSGNYLTARIPGNSTTGNLTVIDKSTGLQAASQQVFFNSFSGSGFNASQISGETNFPESSEIFDLALCDFNNDNKLDVAVTKVTSATDIDVYQNKSTPGTISFQKLSKFTNPELDLLSTTSTITTADIDGDGLMDIITTKSGNPRNVVFVLRNISTASAIKFEAVKSFFLASDNIALKVLVRDLDNDGKPEMIVTNTFNNVVSVFKNTSTVGNVAFSATPITITMTGANTTGGLAIEDLNNDGYPDIAVNPYIEANLYISVNQSTPGNLSFGSSQAITIAGNLNNITAGDYNEDGKIDLAITKTIQNQVIILLNQSDKGASAITFDTPITVATDGGPWGISTADMDGNGKEDLVVGLRDTRSVDLLLNGNTTGQASFTKTAIPTALFTRNIAGADIDGDARPDFIYTSFDATASKYNLSVMRNLNCFVPVVKPSGSQVLCSGGTIHLVSNQGYGIEYRWDKDNVVVKDTSENFYDVTQSGTFKVLAISADSTCQKVSNAVIVTPGTGTAPPPPVIDNTGPFCTGDDIVLTTGAVTNASYSWTGPNGFTSTSQNLTISAATAQMAGVYTLIETVGGCNSDPTSSIVAVEEMPDFTASTNDPTTFCSGNNVTLTVDDLSGYSYQWLKDNVAVSGATSTTFIASQNGSFSVNVTSVSSGCSIASNAIDLTSVSQPKAIFTVVGTLCTGTKLTLTNNSTYESSQPVSFTWNYGDGSLTDTTKNSTHIYTQSGTFSLRLKVAYKNGACADSVAQGINMHSSPASTISQDPDTVLCSGLPKILTVDQDYPSYEWSTGDTTKSINITASDTYDVIVTDQNSCRDTSSVDVTFLQKPTVTATVDKQQVDPGMKVNLEATGALTYEWTPAELLDNSSSATPVATVFDSTLFVVTGTNADGCSDTASVLVTIPPGNGINVVPAKLFSPNGDGIDDLWIIKSIELYPDCSVTIYNGNGRIVYEASPYNNDWNAVYNGTNLPEGVYFYIIKANGKIPKTGSVTLIR